MIRTNPAARSRPPGPEQARRASKRAPSCGMLASVKPVETNAGPGDNAAPSVYDENGVDRSLIRSALDRTPTECLEVLEDLLELGESVRRADEPVR